MSIKDTCWLCYANGGSTLWRLAFEACDVVGRLRRCWHA